MYGDVRLKYNTHITFLEHHLNIIELYYDKIYDLDMSVTSTSGDVHLPM